MTASPSSVISDRIIENQRQPQELLKPFFQFSWEFKVVGFYRGTMLFFLFFFIILFILYISYSKIGHIYRTYEANARTNLYNPFVIY